MTESETHIMQYFKLYGVRANEMLFFNGLAKAHPARFNAAMSSLIQRGFVNTEKPRDAFSLTLQGYGALVSTRA